MEPLCKHAAKWFITGVQLKEFHECAMLMIQKKTYKISKYLGLCYFVKCTNIMPMDSVILSPECLSV